MAKQIYIDENGNEVPVSGTIATAGNLPLGSDFSDPTSTAYAINGLKVKRQYFTATTTTYGNIALGSEFSPNTQVIIAATARNKTTTTTVYLANIYQNDVNQFGTTYGLNIRDVANNNAVANTTVEGYIWLVAFE